MEKPKLIESDLFGKIVSGILLISVIAFIYHLFQIRSLRFKIQGKIYKKLERNLKLQQLDGNNLTKNLGIS
jgi:hypothetical protein